MLLPLFSFSGLSAEHGSNKEVDPLTCPKCLGKIKIISVIEDEKIIKKILKHLSLWDLTPRPAAERTETLIDDSHRGVGPYGPEAFSQLPVPDRHCSRSGEAGGSDNYLSVDPQYPEVYPPDF
jgi:hypothetical protein